MKFMNEYDLQQARIRFTAHTKPNRLGLVMVVDALREWADTVSDGWAYWPKPARAAAAAISLIESRTYAENQEQERVDITDAELAAAVRPIKAFLTRAARDGVRVTDTDREWILRGASS